MADLDLGTALQMFSNGMKEFAFTRALSGANEAVQNIKSSMLGETEKRTQLQNVSNQLVTHMAGMGVPATTIQQVAGAIGPPHFSNSNQMNMYGLETGSSNLQDMAKEQQGFEQNPAYKMELLQAKSLNSNPLAKAKFANEQSEFNSKQQEQFLKQIDPTQASSRTAFGAGAQAIQKAQRINELMGDPSQFSKMNTADLTLVAEGLSNIAKGGVATKEEIDALVPHTSGTEKARILQFMSNKPEPAQLQAFAQKYKDLIDRETNANRLSSVDTIMARANAFAGHASKDPQYANQMKLSLASSLQNLGVNVSPDELQFDKGKGFAIPQYETAKFNGELAAKTVKEAYGHLNSSSGSPEESVAAMNLINHFGLTPNTPIKQASDIVRKKVRMGIFQ